MYLYFI